tara:strand:- start:6264 stop:6737 length:474 start_codon:yes stop_codon:yes gene_type:complete
MILKVKILLIIGSATVLFGCIKDDNSEVVPILNFEEYTVFTDNENNVDSALFKFLFMDGDGDIGSVDSTEFNCFLLYEEKNGDSIAAFPEIGPREYSFPNLTPNSKNKHIEGSISLIIKPAPVFNFFTDSAYRYSCYVVDRAGNVSNSISTDWNGKD